MKVNLGYCHVHRYKNNTVFDFVNFGFQAADFSIIRSGTTSWQLGVPTIGEFKNGRGEFYDQETLNGRAILVRFVISDITPNSCRFEQAFSDDGGKTWEVNWVAVDTRVKE